LGGVVAFGWGSVGGGALGGALGGVVEMGGWSIRRVEIRRSIGRGKHLGVEHWEGEH